MTRNEFRDRVYKAFIAGWATAYPNMPYNLDNEAFTPPSLEDPESVWVRLVVRHQGYKRINLAPRGQRKYEHSAEVILQIFTVPNTGTQSADEIGQAFSDIYGEDLGRDDIFDGEGSFRERGQAEGWNMATATAKFTYQEIR
jgi:hypothetical protein